ncbi:hypothetical protein AB0C28_42510 [Nonomuraea sp. NPDC048892]|uniref:hypothetical protein n=1 Tax=Nonomuraea sp. NPDC048892 TaxID=3154624 RepID=UPI0033CBAE04
MDPDMVPTLAAIVSAIVGGTAGEAGKQAWTSLTALVRRRFGGDDSATAIVESPAKQQPEEIAQVLVDRAHTDPEFELTLAKWMTDTVHLIRHTHVVHNSIGGSAHVNGPVVQAGDVFGSINFGRS